MRNPAVADLGVRDGEKTKGLCAAFRSLPIAKREI
jgi:hypothetical protein